MSAAANQAEQRRTADQAAKRCAYEGCEAESELNGSRRFCRAHRVDIEQRIKIMAACRTLRDAEFILQREYDSFLSRIDREYPFHGTKPGPAGRMGDG